MAASFRLKKPASLAIPDRLALWHSYAGAIQLLSRDSQSNDWLSGFFQAEGGYHCPVGLAPPRPLQPGGAPPLACTTRQKGVPLGACLDQGPGFYTGPLRVPPGLSSQAMEGAVHLLRPPLTPNGPGSEYPDDHGVNSGLKIEKKGPCFCKSASGSKRRGSKRREHRSIKLRPVSGI